MDSIAMSENDMLCSSYDGSFKVGVSACSSAMETCPAFPISTMIHPLVTDVYAWRLRQREESTYVQKSTRLPPKMEDSLRPDVMAQADPVAIYSVFQ